MYTVLPKVAIFSIFLLFLFDDAAPIVKFSSAEWKLMIMKIKHTKHWHNH